MATSKVLQKANIVEIIGSTIRIAHPTISSYPRTEVIAPITSGGTTLYVSDNNTFADNDWFIIGEVGDNKTEEGDVNGAVTRGTSMTITNTNKFSHEIHSPVTKIYERGIKIYGASTDGGAGTLIASVDAITTPIADAVMIQWNQGYTEYTLQSTDTAYAYYYVKFTDGTTDGASSDYVLAAGLAYNSVEDVIKGALEKVNATIDPEPDGKIGRNWLLSVANDFQDEVGSYEMTNPDGRKVSKDWSFEMFEDKTSLTLVQDVVSYALSGLSETLKYTDSAAAILNVRLGDRVLKYIDIDTYDSLMVGKKNTQVATQALAGDTTLVLDDTYEFSESGSVTVLGQTLTYTGNTQSTGTLTGIPASGTGSITATIAVDSTVWQGAGEGMPTMYTIFDGNILLDKPPSSTYAGYKLKVRGLKKMPRLTSFSDEFIIPFTHIAKIYIAAEIEFRKGNDQSGFRLKGQWDNKLNDQALKDKTQALQTLSYYNFGTDEFDENERGLLSSND